MPTELYGTLYGHDNLYIVMTMLKDIYAKKASVCSSHSCCWSGPKEPQLLSPSSAPPPEILLKSANEAILEEKIAQLTETLYQMGLEGKPVQKPFKPFITQPRRRCEGGFDKRMPCMWLTFQPFRWMVYSIRSLQKIPSK